jgi:hypothetical protein
MKIAIFGDSFADDIGMGGRIPKWQNYPHIGPSYIQLLEQHKEFEITRYGWEGSSLYFTLKRFEEFHNQYDKVIFVVTEAGRMYVDPSMYFLPHPHFYGAFTVTLNKEHIKQVNVSGKRLLQLMEKFYFPEIFKRPQNTYDHDMLKKKIKRIRPDAIVIPGVGYTNEFCLNDVATMEIENWGLTWSGFSGGTYIDRRKCHMTDENNHVLYKGLLDCLQNNTRIDLKLLPWTFPSKSAEFYRSRRTD